MVKVFSQMPGMKKYGNVTMKKGVFKGDNKFWDWLKQIEKWDADGTMNNYGK